MEVLLVEIEDGGIDFVVLLFDLFNARFRRTWIAFKTPNADLAMEFLPLIVWNLSIAHSKC